MSETEAETEEAPKKATRIPLILGFLLALIGGGGGFYAAWSGMILSDDSTHKTSPETTGMPAQEVAFVSIDPLVISLGERASAQHLRFRADLEVPVGYEGEVKKVLPRIADVLNSYLRALDPGDLENRAALARLRAQMLRRIQVVVGEGRVNDLLVLEFVLN